MKKVSLIFLLPALLIAVAGCGREVSQTTLTVQIEGAGQVSPSEGSHEYTRDSVVDLTATPVN